jgi:hypothetical protein
MFRFVSSLVLPDERLMGLPGTAQPITWLVSLPSSLSGSSGIKRQIEFSNAL